ncbi:MAG: ornithine cyclodeaminase family protein [Acidobacteriota bacterium]
MPIRETLILGRQDIRRLLDMGTALQVVEAAFASHGRGETRMPAKIYLDLPEFAGDFRAMPAYLPALKAAGVKWVSSHSGNPRRGLPAVVAVLILSDPETAEPLAVMDATLLTLLRTGAAGGVAARHLSREDSSVLALVGAGAQSHAQLDAVRRVRPIRKVKLFDPDPQAVQRLKRRFKDADLEILTCPTVREAVDQAHIVATTTPSRKPVVEREWIAAGTHLNAMGADAPGKQELHPQILLDGEVFIDDPHQARHSGEINVPLAGGVLKMKQLRGTLGEVVAGRHPGRSRPEAITVFDSTGLAVQDLAVARAVYDAAVKSGVGQSFPLAVGAPGSS